MADVRPATLDDVDRLAQIAAAGFYDDPVMGWVFPDAAVRLDRLQVLFGGLARDTPLYGQVSVGPRWVTGGSFGPEAGIAGTAVIVLLIALLLWAPWVRESAAMRGLRPLVDDRLGADG